MAFVERKKRSKPQEQITTMRFGNIIGVDFRKDECASNRSPDSVNFSRSMNGEWETHAGFRIIGTFPVVAGEAAPVLYGFEKFQYKSGSDILVKYLLHAGNRLYTWDNYPTVFTTANLTCIYGSGADKLPASIMAYATYYDELVLLGGGKMLVYDGTTVRSITDGAYIPQTWQAKSPSASAGSTLNQHNFIQPKFTESFVGDGVNLTDQYTATAGQTVFATTKNILTIATVKKDNVDVAYTITGAMQITLTVAASAGNIVKIAYLGGSSVYQLADTGLDAAAATAVVDSVDKAETTNFTVNRTTGAITFLSGDYPMQPSIAGTPNVFITAAKTFTGYADLILNCTVMLAIDSRLILSGNPKEPNRIFWCAFKELTYFGEIQFNDSCGSGSVPITALQQLFSNSFLAIKKDTVQDGSYAVITADETAIDSNLRTYRADLANGTIGCLSKDSSIVFVDDNIFVSKNGVKAISRNLNTSSERNIEHRSSTIDPELLLENLDHCYCEQHDNKLYILCQDTGHIYVADGFSKGYTKSEGTSLYDEYEWAFLADVGVYKSQYPRFVDTDGETTLNPPNASGVETGTRTGGTELLEQIGGVFYPAQLLKSLGDKELYFGCDGYLLKFNFDLNIVGRANELTPAAYSFNNRKIGDYCCLPDSWFGVSNAFKTLRNERNDMILAARSASLVDIYWKTEKTLFNSTTRIRIVSSGTSYAIADYSARNYGSLPVASYVLKKIKARSFRRLQIKIETAKMNCCTSFVNITLDAELLDKNLK